MNRDDRTLRRLARAAGGVGLFGAVGLAWGLMEAEARVVRTHTLRVLPPGAPDLRVLHLSDIHLLPHHRGRQEWLRGLAALEPDLVVNTGDNIGAAAAIGPLLDALAPLLERPGVFVPGSNDYYAPKPANPLRYFAGPSQLEEDRPRLPSESLFSAFRAAGWADLTNRGATLHLGEGVRDDGTGVHGDGQGVRDDGTGVLGAGAAPRAAGDAGDVGVVRVTAAGTDDPHLGMDAWPGFDAGADADEARGGFRLGVTHAPYRRVLDAMTADGADLLLAGHTHGGQICLPFVGALVTNCDLPRRQASGVSSWTAAGRTVPLEVSAGIGAAPSVPLRYACRPEAVVLELRARS